MKTKDSLERLLPNQRIDDGLALRPVECDFMWMSKLDWHGDLPTKCLLAYADLLGFRKDATRGNKRLGHLYRRANTPHSGRYLDRYERQFRFPGGYIPRNIHVVHRLDAAGKQALKERGKYVGLAPRGAWEHQVMTASITAAAELWCLKNGYRFIPRHEISRSLVFKNIPYQYRKKVWNTQKRCSEDILQDGAADLFPDGFFGIDYGPSIRYFFVEADRQNETNAAGKDDGKTHERSFSQYQHLIRTGKYKTLCGIKDQKPSTGVLLFATVAEGAKDNLKKLVGEMSSNGKNSYTLFNVVKEFGTQFNPPPPLYRLFGPWERAGMDPLDISVPPQVPAAAAA